MLENGKEQRPIFPESASLETAARSYSMQSHVELFGVASDILAWSIVYDTADNKARSDGKPERRVQVRAAYPSPAPRDEGPACLFEVELNLSLPWRTHGHRSERGDDAIPPLQEDDFPPLCTPVPSASHPPGTPATPYKKTGKAAEQVRNFIRSLVRVRVLTHPRRDGVFIAHRTSMNSQTCKDLACGRGSTALIEYLCLRDEAELLRIPDDKSEIKSRLPMMALTGFSKVCTCLINATLGSRHGGARYNKVKDVRFMSTLEMGAECKDRSRPDSHRRQLEICTAAQLIADQAFVCLMASDFVLQVWAHELPTEPDDPIRLPPDVLHAFSPLSTHRNRGPMWLDMHGKRGELYKNALGQGALYAGVSWAMMKFCGLWNPAIGVDSYGNSEFDVFFCRLNDSTFHRALFSGPAQIRVGKGGPSALRGPVSQLPLSILDDNQYQTLLRNSPCKDVVSTSDDITVPAVSIAVGRGLYELRLFSMWFLKGVYASEMLRLFTDQSTMDALGRYDRENEHAMMQKVRHIVRIGFGAEVLASMLVRPEQALSATFDDRLLPAHIADLVWLLCRMLRDVLHPNCGDTHEHLEEVLPKILLPLATFSLQWCGTQTPTKTKASPRPLILPHGFGLGNEYDCEPVAVRAGRVLSQEARTKWLVRVKKQPKELHVYIQQLKKEKLAKRGKKEEQVCEQPRVKREPCVAVDPSEAVYAGVTGVPEATGDGQSPVPVAGEGTPCDPDDGNTGRHEGVGCVSDGNHADTRGPPEVVARNAVSGGSDVQMDDVCDVAEVGDGGCEKMQLVSKESEVSRDAGRRDTSGDDVRGETEVSGFVDGEHSDAHRCADQEKEKPTEPVRDAANAGDDMREEVVGGSEKSAGETGDNAVAQTQDLEDGSDNDTDESVVIVSERRVDVSLGNDAHHRLKDLLSAALVPHVHRRCHMGGLHDGETNYTSMSCFISSTLAHNWDDFEACIDDQRKEGSFPPRNMGTCHVCPRDAGQHFAALTWADASMELLENLRNVANPRAPDNIVPSNGVVYMQEEHGGIDAHPGGLICTHCVRRRGLRYVEVRVAIGYGIVEMMGYEDMHAVEQRAQRAQRECGTKGKNHRVRDRTLHPGMFLGLCANGVGSRVEVAYLRNIDGLPENRHASLVFLEESYLRLRRARNEEHVEFHILYDAEVTSRLLSAFGKAGLVSHADRVAAVTGEPSAVQVTAIRGNLDPILECLSNPLAYFELRDRAKRKVDGYEAWLDVAPCRLANPSSQTCDEDEMMAIDAREKRATAVDTLFGHVSRTKNLNESQLKVIRDQMYSHVDVRKGDTRPPRRIIFVQGGGGVGKSTLMCPLISLNLATNWDTKGHAFSGSVHKGNWAGDVVVGVFAVMNRTLDSCVKSLLAPGALLTPAGSQSMARIVRIGRGSEDDDVKIVTLDHMATAPDKDLHPAWQDPGPHASLDDTARFAEFTTLRANCKRWNEVYEPEARYRGHVARQKLYHHLINNAHVVASTLGTAETSVLSSKVFKRHFSTVYMEECGKTGVPELFFIPMAQVGRERVQNVVLFGDHKQNLPYTKSQERIPAAYLQRSFLEVVVDTPKSHVFTLDTQYRMHPMIAEYVSASFYGGRLANGLRASHFLRPYHDDAERRFPPVLFLDTEGDRMFAEVSDRELEPEDDDDDTERTSHGNIGESRLAVSIALTLATEYAQNWTAPSQSGHSVGTPRHPKIIIVTPYTAQLVRIERMLRDSPQLEHTPWKVIVLTAERVQGEEADVVIVSTVRSQVYMKKTAYNDALLPHRILRKNPVPGGRRARFVSQRNRVAVMLTRARYAVIVIGDGELLSSREAAGEWDDVESDGYKPPWAHFIQFCADQKLLRSAREAVGSYQS